MFGMTVKIRNEVERVRRAGRDAARGSFARTAFLIRKTAVESIDLAEGPSPPGSPPHTHTKGLTKKGKQRKGNQALKRFIIYSADKEGAVIGPIFSRLKTVGQAHEFGGEYKGGDYPERPFMGPAMEENLDAFAQSWNGSISR